MKNPREEAKTVLKVLKKIDDESLKKELVLLFLTPYVLYTKERVSSQETGLTDKIIKFLQDVAEGRIVIGEEVELIPGTPDIKSLVDELERAQREGLLEEAQIRKALLRAFLAQKRKEQAEAARHAPPVSPELPIGKPPRMAAPEPKKETGTEKEEKAKKEKIIGKLLIRISYKKPSVLGMVAKELATIPFGPPSSAPQEFSAFLLSRGISPETLRLGIEEFRKDRPELGEGGPFVASLIGELKNLEGFVAEHPEVKSVFSKYQAGDVRVKISVFAEGEIEPRDSDLVKSTAVQIYQAREEMPQLRLIETPPPLLGQAQETRAIRARAIAGLWEEVKQKILIPLSKFLTRPLSLLRQIRTYLGGVLIAAGVALPLPTSLRAVGISLGFWLAWREIKRFIQNVIPAATLPLRSIPFLLFLSRGINNILGHLYTKPTLSWLRTSLATGFGLGAFFLPVPFPIKALFLVFGGSLGLSQTALSFDRITTVFLGFARAGERLTFALSDTRGPRQLGIIILGALLVAIFGPAIFSYLTINQAQGTFLTAGGTVAPESRFIQITVSTSPQNIRNEELPKRINFTVVVTAREKALTIVSIKETFATIAKDKTITIPEKILTVPKTRLAPGESTEIKFSLEVDRNFEDSATTTTATVSALVDGQAPAQTASASTTVIVGSPPTSCFAFLGNWNEVEKNRVTAAIAFVSKSQALTIKLCAGARTVRLMRGAGRDWSGEVDGANGITLFDRAFNAPYQPAHLYYTLAHETGHVYGNYNSAVFSAFRQEVREPFLETYSRDKKADEDFAETIGMFITRRHLPSPFTGVNLPTLWETYPQHYHFAKNYIFTDGVEY